MMIWGHVHCTCDDMGVHTCDDMGIHTCDDMGARILYM